MLKKITMDRKMIAGLVVGLVALSLVAGLLMFRSEGEERFTMLPVFSKEDNAFAYEVNTGTHVITKTEDEELEQFDIPLAGNFDHATTAKGILLWNQRVPEKEEELKSRLELAKSESSIQAEAVWFDFEEEEFTTLPSLNLSLKPNQLEAVYEAYLSKSENKIALRVGAFNPAEIRAGIYQLEKGKAFQPKVTSDRTLIYNLETKQLSESSLSEDLKKADKDGLHWMPKIWDSLRQTVVSKNAREELIFVSLDGSQKHLLKATDLYLEKIQNIFGSKDGKWVVVIGAGNKQYGILLFDENHALVARKQIAWQAGKAELIKIKDWSEEGGKPKLTLNDAAQTVVDFNDATNVKHTFVSKVPAEKMTEQTKLIENYYRSIAEKDYELAYSISPKNVSFEQFKNWYKGTLQVELTSVEEWDEDTLIVETNLLEKEGIVENYRAKVDLEQAGGVPTRIARSAVTDGDFELYQNEVYGFQFEYDPLKWEIYGDMPDSAQIKLISKKEDSTFYITIEAGQFELTDVKGSNSFEKTEWEGKEAYVRTNSRLISEVGLLKDKDVYLEHGGHYLWLGFAEVEVYKGGDNASPLDENYDEINRIHDEFVRTFNWVDPTMEYQEWGLHKDSEIPFTFEYLKHQSLLACENSESFRIGLMWCHLQKKPEIELKPSQKDVYDKAYNEVKNHLEPHGKGVRGEIRIIDGQEVVVITHPIIGYGSYVDIYLPEAGDYWEIYQNSTPAKAENMMEMLQSIRFVN